MLKRYGITITDFNSMIIKQSGLCAVCDEQLIKPCLDHDHETGAVRALLCNNCNIAIGHLKDDPQRCISAAWYLMQHENAEVLHD